MSERKVLNKYYPPDFDPSKLPRRKSSSRKEFTVRSMIPFDMQCINEITKDKNCGCYIYKATKYNVRKEDVIDDNYLGLRIYRFYFKCPQCLQDILYKTDPKNADYVIEAGAIRNYEQLKLSEEQEQHKNDKLKEEEALNPIKLLERRTQQSKRELEQIETLEDLKDLNKRQHSVDYDKMLKIYDTKTDQEKELKKQEENDEKLIKSIFKKRKIIQEKVDNLLPPKKISKIDRSATSVNIKKISLKNTIIKKNVPLKLVSYPDSDSE